jgi:hypothetical protein
MNQYYPGKNYQKSIAAKTAQMVVKQIENQGQKML